jgi:uncharacterized protein DUF4192
LRLHTFSERVTCLDCVKEFVIVSPLSRSRLSLRSPSDVLGAVPYLLGHHPDPGSLVVLLVGRDRRVCTVARLDIPGPVALAVADLVPLIARYDVESLIVAGYGPPDLRPVVVDAADRLRVHVPVAEVLLVSGDRFFCLACQCPASGGVAFDPTSSIAAVESTVAGLVALPDRAALLAVVAPDPVAQAAVAALTARLPVDETGDAARVVRSLMEVATGGRRLSDGQVARMAVALRDRTARDVAWQATTGQGWQRDLWLDVTRRAPDADVTGPASLAAWCAWMRGEELVAATAAHRALAVTPADPLSRLVAMAVAAHIPADEVICPWPPDDATPHRFAWSRR